MTDNQQVQESHKAWIEDGILYHEYRGEISIHSVMEIEKQSMDLINKHNIPMIPAIAILKDITKTSVKFSMADWSKTISAINIVTRVSGVWVVGADEEVQKSFRLVNRFFVNDGIKFVDTLEEAKQAAHAARSLDRSILDVKLF